MTHCGFVSSVMKGIRDCAVLDASHFYLLVLMLKVGVLYKRGERGRTKVKGSSVREIRMHFHTKVIYFFYMYFGF